MTLTEMVGQLLTNDTKVGEDPYADRGRRDDKAAGIRSIMRFGKGSDGQFAGNHGLRSVKRSYQIGLETEPELLPGAVIDVNRYPVTAR